MYHIDDIVFSYHLHLISSLQEWTDHELETDAPGIHRRVAQEKKFREQVLDIRQSLAREVTQRSREVAGKTAVL